MSHPLAIKAGDGAKEPGSFTRFVLPFAYNAVFRGTAGLPRDGAFRNSGAGQPPAWRTAAGRERRLYLTPETGAVLHDHALWLELDAEEVEFDFVAQVGPKQPSGGRAGRSFKRLRPKLVLFEWAGGVSAEGAPAGKANRSAEKDLLKTGFLIVDIAVADTQTTLDDLLFFNERFRYWHSPWDKHETASGYAEVVSDYIHQSGDCPPVDTAADAYLDRWDALLRIPMEADDKRYELVSGDAIKATRAWAKSGTGPDLGWVVYTDNRAFVWTCAVMGSDRGEEAGANILAREFGGAVAIPSGFGHWLRLVNVDEPLDTPWQSHATVSSFERKWIEAATYLRWAHGGSWYGYCQHAGAAIVPSSVDPPVWQHFRDMYFDQVLLLLYLRVATFRFSQSLCEISAEARRKGRKHEPTFHEDFQKLRWDFALLTNLYRFPLVSSQQQGIEMYAVARKQLDVDELFGEVEQEIRASEEYLSSRVNLRQATTAARLQVVATLALPLGVLLAAAQVFESLGQWKWAVSFGLGALAWVGTIGLWCRTERVMRWMSRTSRCIWNGDSARCREDGPGEAREENCDD